MIIVYQGLKLSSFFYYRTSEAELKTANEQLTMYQEMLLAKDQSIMSLTHQVFEFEKGQGLGKGQSAAAGTNTTLKTIADAKELEKYKVGGQVSL